MQDFCILILYPLTLLNSLISFNSFFDGSLVFSIYSVISSTNSFISSFLFWMPFNSFSCLIALARTTNTTTWNRSGDSEHPVPCS